MSDHHRPASCRRPASVAASTTPSRCKHMVDEIDFTCFLSMERYAAAPAILKIPYTAHFLLQSFDDVTRDVLGPPRVAGLS